MAKLPRLLLSLTGGRALSFDEAQHPREAAGSDKGGEFTSKRAGGVAHEKSIKDVMGSKDRVTVDGVDGRKVTLVRYRRPGKLPTYKIRHRDGTEQRVDADHRIEYLAAPEER